MGYPMTYQRVVSRNHLHGGYAWNKELPPECLELEMLCGDLRRLEEDQRDVWHLRCYAATAGVTVEQARAVLDALFGDRPLVATAQAEGC